MRLPSSFNEPDLDTQSNISPQDAAKAWQTYIQPLAGSAKLVSPAVTNGVKAASGAPMGVAWLKEFVAACDGCTIDAFAVNTTSFPGIASHCSLLTLRTCFSFTGTMLRGLLQLCGDLSSPASLLTFPISRPDARSSSNTAYFTSYLEQAYKNLSKPIWLTEVSEQSLLPRLLLLTLPVRWQFMGTGSATDQATFLKFADPWLEQQTFIEKYAAFGAFAFSPLAMTVLA